MVQIERIVITGLGAVTPLGIGVIPFWNRLISGETGVCESAEFIETGLPITIAALVPDFNPCEYMPRDLLRNSVPFSQYAFVAAKEAIKQSNIDTLHEGPHIGITMGTALSGSAFVADNQKNIDDNQLKHVSARFVPQIIGNTAAALIAIDQKITGPCYTVTTACSSGNDALGLAFMLLQNSKADVMIAVGADSAFNPLVVSSLARARALTPNPDPTTASRPFDIERDGFVIGEGAGAMILETESHALARHANILGTVLAVTNNTDGYNVVAPEPNGLGAIACMKDALKQANLDPKDIGYINAHGTSTRLGDAAECRAIEEVFQPNIPYISSTKGATGHMMGAGGIVEAIVCLLAIQNGILPLNTGCKNLDPQCCNNIITGSSISVDINYAMSNSLGFGGQNASVIIGSY